MQKLNIFHNQDDIHGYQAGDVIFEQGAPGDYLYDVISGTVILSREGRELTQLEAGEIFGETGLINHEAHSVTAIAKTDCEIAQVSKRRFEFMVSETPNFALKVMRVLAERLSKETAKHMN